MSAPGFSTQDDTTVTLRTERAADRPNLRHVLACIDTSMCGTNPAPVAEVIVAHATAIAEAVGARITLMHVLESAVTEEPMDPVEWALRQCDAAASLHERMMCFGDPHADTVIVAGLPAERIITWAHDNAVDLIVLGRGGENHGTFVGLGDTARRVTEAANASVLLVPSTRSGDTPVRYLTVMIPLDGSARSECALPLGLRIAAAHGAEVMLVHAAPKLDLIETELINPDAIALRDRVYQHNERAARQYLDWLKARLPAPPPTKTRLLTSGDARIALGRSATDERADLMILSAAGKSGYADMTVGSVADYLINRISIPVLLVRQTKRQLSVAAKKPDQTVDTRLRNQGMM